MPRGYSGGGYSGGLHYRADGGLDMRYSSSREAVASGYGSYGGGGYSSSSYSGGNSYSSELHYRGDGELDMRYTSSRAAVASASAISSSISRNSQSTAPDPDLHYRNDGGLDMRYSSSRAAVAKVSAGTSSSGGQDKAKAQSADQLHYRNDGELDMRFKSSKAAAAEQTSDTVPRNNNGKKSGGKPNAGGSASCSQAASSTAGKEKSIASDISRNSVTASSATSKAADASKQGMQLRSGRVLSEPLAADKFRKESQKKTGAVLPRKTSPPPGREACHKVPNVILTEAYNKTDDPAIKKSVKDFAHSNLNIFYSDNNKEHTRQEHAMEFNKATSAQWQQKTAVMHTALHKFETMDVPKGQRGELKPKEATALVIQTAAEKSCQYKEAMASYEPATRVVRAVVASLQTED